MPRISLSHQHIKNFKNNGVNLISYHDLNKKHSKEYEYYKIVCFINSLLLLKDFEFENKIIFIEEVDSFIQSIIDNTTIKAQKQIYTLLMRMINKCHTLIINFELCYDKRFCV